jgi:histidyl-tRNA synthetase
MGDVVLGELLKDRGLHPALPASIDAFVAAVTADDVPHVLHLAHRLRRDGIRVEYALAPSSLGKQLTLANARGAAFAVVIGPDDRAAGTVQLKNLRDKGQRSIAPDDVAAAIRQPHLLHTTHD